MRLTLLLLLFIGIIFSPINAQTDSNREKYALLWEISGNGLEESSYLFGSMHVREGFAFQFPDSLLYYLSKCDAFANEVHLDSAMLRVFEIYLGDDEIKTDSSYIEFIKTKKVQKDASVSYENMRFDSLLNGINLTDLEGDLNITESDTLPNKPTMLDAYLMNIASGFGKNLYGLEKIDNHFYDSGTTYSGFSFFNSSHINLQNQYYHGDLDGIQQIIQKEAASYDDLELIPRNFIMVESMLRIMAKQSLFSVVGAAHLPGKEGVIELLREEGYTLRSVLPVFTSKGKDAMHRVSTIANNKGGKKRPWPKIEEEGIRFQAATSLPYVFKNVLPFESSYLQADIGRGLFYLVLTSSMTPYEYDNFDEYFFNNDGYEILNKTSYTLNGLKGHKYELQKLGEDIAYFLGYVFIKNGELYYLQIGAYESETLDKSSDPRSFIKRFSVEKSYPDKWRIMTDSVGAFSVNLSRHFVSRKNIDAYSYDNWATTYSAGFDGTQSSVGLKYYNLSPDLFLIHSDSSKLSEEFENIEKYLGAELKIASKTDISWTFEGEYEEKNLYINGFIQIRGNRVYSLFSIDKKGQTSTKKFLKSFQLLPYKTQRLQEPTYMADSLFQCYIPGRVKETRHKDNAYTDSPIIDSYQHLSTDNNSGVSYKLFVDKLHPLFGTTDTIGFLKVNMEDFSKEVEYLPSTKLQPSLPEVNALFHNGKRQVYISGDYIIKKTVYADSTYLASPVCQQFFEEDIWAKNRSNAPTLLVNKGDTLINLLSSNDTSHWFVLNTAIDADFSFENQHSTIIKKQLIDLKWSDSYTSKSLQEKLLFVLINLDASDTISTLSSLYYSAPKGSFVRLRILNELTKMEGQVFQDAFFNLLEKDAELVQTAPRYLFYKFFRDSSLFINNTHHIQRLLDSGKDHLLFWELAISYFNTSEAGEKAVFSIINSFVKRGQARLTNDNATALNKNDYHNIENVAPFTVLGLYQLFPDNEAIKKQIESLLNRNVIDEISVEAARFVLTNKGNLPKAKLKQLLSHKNTWLPMIRLLNEHKLLGTIKNKYYDREAIAKAILTDRFEIDEVEVSEIKMEDTISTDINGELKMFYIFSFNYNDQPSRLAVVGQFYIDKNERHFIDIDNVNYTDYPVVKRRRTRKAKALVEELVDVKIDFDWSDFGIELEEEVDYKEIEE